MTNDVYGLFSQSAIHPGNSRLVVGPSWARDHRFRCWTRPVDCNKRQEPLFLSSSEAYAEQWKFPFPEMSKVSGAWHQQ